MTSSTTLTSELIGDPLDWAVALCLGGTAIANSWLKDRKRGYLSCFSRHWDQGGGLLEQCVENGMLIERVDPQYDDKLPKFKVSLDRWATTYRGDTLLVAVCRCYVAYKLGASVVIPPEVLALGNR